MAELTNIEEKLAEVLGLARAAQDATDKVAGLVEDDEVEQTLRSMHEDAVEAERRCEELAGDIEGKKTAIDEKASETKAEAVEMMRTYLGEDADGLDGLEFLVMAEAGELGHVEVVGKLNETAGDERIRELVEWALPVQQKHFEQTRKATLRLAGQEDPTDTQ
jgi:hypothetical protein